MHQQPKVMDEQAVNTASSVALRCLRESIVRAKRADLDEDRMDRLKECKCKVCFYLRVGQIAGAAMTERPCGICGTSVMYGSTNTDAICHDCAKKHRICKHCGADLELRTFRRKFGWIKPQALLAPPEKPTGIRTVQPVFLLPMKEPHARS